MLLGKPSESLGGLAVIVAGAVVYLLYARRTGQAMAATSGPETHS